MAVQINSDEGKALRALIPLENYPKGAFEELCTNISVEQVQDNYLFKKGDTQTDLVYLLSGSVTLQAQGLIIEVIEAKSESARFALAHQIPRKIDAFANGPVRFVRLNADLVNNPPAAEYEDESGYTIIEESDADADDWLNVLLRLPLFQSLPPANLQKLLISITTAQFAAGDVILETGSTVEYFYIVNRGQCVRTRPGSTGSVERKTLTGETFGDEYLILEIPSKEKIIALTNVTLIQLTKQQFAEQVIQPLLKQINADEANALVNEGALLLDVRSKQLAEKNPLDTGINIPYVNLYNKVIDLDNDRKIITSGDQKTSLAAAFLLLLNNFEVYVFNDGSEPEEFEIVEDKVSVDNSFRGETAAPINAKLKAHLILESTDTKLSEEETREKSSLKTLDPKAELRFLRAENKRLTAYTRHLEGKTAQLKIEKQKLTMRSQLLELQLKKLKEIMLSYSKK